MKTGRQEMVNCASTDLGQWCDKALQNCHSGCVVESRERLLPLTKKEALTTCNYHKLRRKQYSSITGHYPDKLAGVEVVFVCFHYCIERLLDSDYGNPNN